MHEFVPPVVEAMGKAYEEIAAAPTWRRRFS